MPESAGWCGQCYASPYGGSTVVTASALTVPRQSAAVSEPPVPVPVPASASLQAAVAGRLLGRRAFALVLGCIGVGAAAQTALWLWTRDSTLEPEALVRYALAATVVVYAVVGALVVAQVRPPVRLRWVEGRPLTAVLFGAGIGGGLGLALLAIVSSASGHISTDPRVSLLVSEGDVTHIAVTALLTMVAAPLVEETLFRGLLVESLRHRGPRWAVWLSAIAFAAWHLNPAALRYYALMGALLGGIYLRRGLVSSMSAHAAFNGVLTIAACVVALTPAHHVQAGPVSLDVPRGWHELTGAPATVDLVLQGPSAATLTVQHEDLPVAPDPQQVLDRLTSGALSAALPGVVVDAAGGRLIDLPDGTAARIGVTARGHHGWLVLLPVDHRAYVLTFESGGSARTSQDFERMLASLHVR